MPTPTPWVARERAARRLAAVAVIVVLVAAVTGCRGGDPFDASDSVQTSLELPAGAPLRVEAFNGSIDVTTLAGTRAQATVERTGRGTTQEQARADRDAIDVTFELVEGEALLRAVYTPNPTSISGRSARVTLAVPEGTPLELVTSNGGVTVRETAASVAVTTSNGPVDIRGATGAVRIETSNASVSVAAEAASADLRTSNGRLAFSGSLAAGPSTFETSNAALELRLPADAAFTLDARTSNSSTKSDFAIAGERSDDVLRGIAGDPGAAARLTITARTSNATLSVLRL